MTNKEYLNQAYRLNERINSDLKELDELRALAVNIGSPSIGERVSGSHSTEAPFARAVIRIDELERKGFKELNLILIQFPLACGGFWFSFMYVNHKFFLYGSKLPMMFGRSRFPYTIRSICTSFISSLTI